MSRLLVVDDEKNMRSLLSDVLESEGHEVAACEDGESGIRLLEAERFDACILDLNLPGVSGLEVLRRSRHLAPPPPAILITAYGTVDAAVAAMRDGAFDFIIKPFDVQRIVQTVSKCLEATDLMSAANLSGPEFQDAQGNVVRIVGNDERLKSVFDTIRRIAMTDTAVMIRGESGTGKELVAQAIHYNGPRKDGPFIAVNCSALPETLLESEFFGFEKGAFTGAYSVKRGKFELADGGTIFLDEIGDMPMSLQVKLLRVLQDQMISRLGSEKTIKVDVRIIAATNRDLEAAVADGEFRDDLYYRLNVVPVHLPPLRERRGDIPMLTEMFARRAAAKNNMQPLAIPPEVMERVQSFEWRGNIRELQNSVERATIMGDSDLIAPAQIPLSRRMREESAEPAAACHTAQDVGLPPGILTLAEATTVAQREAIIRALRKTDGNKLEAARLLGISNKTLYNKLSDLEIKLSLDVK